MDAYQYLLLMAACLLLTLPLEQVLGARAWRGPRLQVLRLLPVVLITAATRGVTSTPSSPQENS